MVTYDNIYGKRGCFQQPSSLRDLSLFAFRSIYMTVKTVELLAPAGNPEALDAAIGEGADAIYLGLRTFNARMRSTNFAFNQFEATVEACRDRKKKVYVTMNTVFEERESDRVWQMLQYLDRIGPDGIIVQDLGLIKMARENFPKLELHASTQMNVASSRGCNLLSRQGFNRVVLARELTLDEIRAVRASTNMEIEIFVHGALCVSASGLCLFSSYLGGKSANRGMCTQACRRLYESETRSGYFFSPDDLELIGQVPDLMEIGVDSFKIEGRMKSAEYVGTVVSAYRHMMDNWQADRERALVKARAILQGDFARRKTSFFISGLDAPASIHPEQAGGTGIALGRIRDIRVVNEERYALMSTWDGLAEGDSLRIHRSDDSGRITAKVREVVYQPHGMLVKFEGDWRQNDEVYLVQTKSLSRRYRPVMPNSLDRFRRMPSFQDAPRPETALPTRKELEALPDGLYVLVGKVADLHAALALKPKKAMIVFDKLNAEGLRKNEGTLPYKKGNLILWLDPYFPEGDAEWLEPELAYWIEKGVTAVVANNLAHFSLLRGKGLQVIAGPWLYAFNTWSAAFLLEQGAAFVVPPLEISKQDLARVEELLPTGALMPVVLSAPPLFRIRGDLSARYDSDRFTDRDKETYRLIGRRDYSTLVSDRLFSLIDRVPFLRKEGITKFIVDLSNIDPSRGLYRDVARAAEEAKVLPDTVRFNWKDGFWSEEQRGAAASAPAAGGSGGSTGGSGQESEGRGEGRSPGARPGTRPGTRPGRATGPRQTAGPRGGKPGVRGGFRPAPPNSTGFKARGPKPR